MSKGSINSVKLPLYFNKEIFNIAKLVRLRDREIVLSKSYTKSMGFEVDVIIKKTIEIIVFIAYIVLQ